VARADPSILDTPGGTAAAEGVSGSGDTGFDFANVEIDDQSLKNKVTLLRIGSQRGTNNLLTVFAGLKNTTGHRLSLEVETIYKDKNGHELNTGSWIHLSLKAHEENDYRSSAITEEAVDFLIRVRHAQVATASTHD
jgi:hypothetical protein